MKTKTLVFPELKNSFTKFILAFKFTFCHENINFRYFQITKKKQQTKNQQFFDVIIYDPYLTL